MTLNLISRNHLVIGIKCGGQPVLSAILYLGKSRIESEAFSESESEAFS